MKLHNRTDDNTHVFAPSPKVYILLRVSDMIFILEAQPTDQIDIKQSTKGQLISKGILVSSILQKNKLENVNFWAL